MTTTIVPVEIVNLLDETKLPQQTRENIIESFGPSFVQLRELLDHAGTITVADATCLTEIADARSTRIKLSKVRTGASKVRDLLKADALTLSKSLDSIARMFAAKCEPIEASLLEMEKVAERAEAARKAALLESRRVLLAPFGVDTQFIDLGAMPQASFEALLEQSEMAHKARVEAAARAEADRIEAERKRAEDDAKIRADNERLRLEAEAAKVEAAKVAAEAKAEQDKRDTEAKAEKAKADAALAAERKAREDAEAEARRVQAEADAEAERIKKAEEAAAEARRLAEAKAAAAPDALKLQAFAVLVRSVPVPSMTTDAGRAFENTINQSLAKLAAWCESKASEIGGDQC